MSTAVSYPVLASLIAKLRIDAEIENQSDLAKIVGASQQTISRWEAGTSRPRANQIPKLSAALKTTADRLLEAAGYASLKASVSFDGPFPLDTMQPESFERLTADLVLALNPTAVVSRVGGQGHTQDGIDVTSVFPNGDRYTFQCKRVAEFGPRKVLEAIEKDTTASKRKFLLLSRTASPEARAVIERHKNWELWDRDDISRLIRRLPVEEQKRLVRIYFRGQEIALLGTSPDSPWETSEEFFAAFTHERALFSHTWSVVGRESIIGEALTRLNDPTVGVTLLTGPGGAGKSRLLRAILEQFTKHSKDWKVRIASPTMDISSASLEELGAAKVLLVVDDAHNRDDLQALFNYAAAFSGRVKLLLAARRYGVDHIKGQASGYSFVDDRLGVIDIPALDLSDAEALARQVLERFGGPVDAAKQIANLTRDCALATVVGAQVVAENKVHPILAQGEGRFRTTLFGRFEDVVTGHFGDREKPEDIRRLLAFLALVQPFSIDEAQLWRSFETVTGVVSPDALRIARLLLGSGVLFKRGAKYRLSPDVLGDYLLEAHFETSEGGSNGLAERYFDALPESYLENLLLNMGRVDWRRTGRTTEESPLLDGVWAKLAPAYEYSDPHISAVKAVAYYQPNRALAFVERLIREGRFRDQLADIAKYAAYTPSHLNQALACLWELGQSDDRNTNPHPSHPIRILTEMVEPQPGKPTWVIDGVVDYFVTIALRDDAWSGPNTPFDVLDGILGTEGHTSSTSKHTWTMTPFFVDPTTVRHWRTKVIDLLLTSLTADNPRKSVSAAKHLANAIRSPHGLLGAHAPEELYGLWDEEFAETLTKLSKKVAADQIDPLVQAELGRTVGWLQHHGNAKVKRAAKRVRSALSSDLDVRINRVLIDGYGMEDRRFDQKGHAERWARYIDQIVADVTNSYPTETDRLAAIEERVRKLATGSKQSGTPEVLVGRFIDASAGFAEALLDSALVGTAGVLSRFAGYALGKVLRDDKAKGRAHIASFLASAKHDLWAAVGIAYGNQRYDASWFVDADLENLGRLIASTDEWVLLCTIRAVQWLSEWDADVALSLVRVANIPNTRVAEELATLFEFGEGLKPSALDGEDAVSLLGKLESIPELNGYWLDKLIANISEYYPGDVVQFFMRRVEAAVADREGSIRPCNFGPYGNERLRVRRTSDGPGLMRMVIAWMRAHWERKGMFNYYSRTLFEALFGPFDAEIVGFFSDWLVAATADDVRTIGSILREADEDFVFTYVPFVSSLLQRAHHFGRKLLRSVSGDLYASAIAGVRHGTHGEPFPEDVALQTKAGEALAKVSRFAPAFELYDGLRQHAEAEIRRAIKEGEEEEDE